MRPELLYGAGGGTSINLIGFTILMIAVVLLFVLPRRHVVTTLLLPSMLIPLGQMVVIGPFHFQVYRIMVLFGWIRLLWQHHFGSRNAVRIRITGVDKAVICYSIACLVCYSLLWQESFALIGQMGKAYSCLGLYFLFRYFVRTEQDVRRAIRAFALIAVAVGACMLNEQITGRNVLAVFGGVPEATTIRGTYMRAQGPFRIYLTAGCFGATVLPLFLALWRRGDSRMMAGAGVCAAVMIAVTSRTSTAISALAAAAVGIGMWKCRAKMRVIRWGVVCLLVALHLIMKAPVWALLARVDFVGGSTGWQRYKIVDNFIVHFWDWWLIGSKNYWNWEGGGDDMWDLANQYVAIGETTGVLSLLAFVAMIVYAFKYLGLAIKSCTGDARREWLLWLLGVCLFSNLIAFLGISYFDQTSVYWYALLAMTVAASGMGVCSGSVRPSEGGIAPCHQPLEDSADWDAQQVPN
jgi:hypothetical protein